MDQNDQPTEKPKRKPNSNGSLVFAKSNSGGPFEKGVSGNPGGRRKNDPRERPEYLKLAKRYSLVALRRLAKMMEDPNVENEVRRKCAVNLLDRAWGKPTESVELNATARSLVQVIVPGTVADPDQWAERTRAIEAARRAPLIEASPVANGDDTAH